MAGASFSKATIQILLNAQNALKDLKSFQNNFTSGMGTMKTALAGFVGYQGLKGAYDSVKQLTDISDKWEIPTEKMSRFRNIIIAMGGDAQEALKTFETLKQAAQQWQFHSDGSLRDLSSRIRDNLFKKDPEAVLATLREHWPQLTLEGRNEALKTLGTDSTGIRNLLKASEAEYLAAQNKAASMPVVTTEDAQAARDIKKSTEQIATNTEKLLSWVNTYGTQYVLKGLEKATNALVNPKDATKGEWAALGGTGLLGGLALYAGGKTASKIPFLGKLGSKAVMLGKGTAGLGALALGGVAGAELADWGHRISARKAADRIANEDFATAPDGNMWLYNQSIIEQALADQGTKFTEEEIKYFREQIDKAGEKAFELYEKKAEAEHNFRMLTNSDYRNAVASARNQTVNQTINIYGIKGAEDIAPALRSVVMQNMSPTQGYGG
ncbi:MAG: hypothetical protein II208_00360 [Alphaproteobacteria bacterium]|nr:hypothetical protein [Alphaproteobacteria bacterium]